VVRLEEAVLWLVRLVGSEVQSRKRGPLVPQVPVSGKEGVSDLVRTCGDLAPDHFPQGIPKARLQAQRG